MRNERAAQVSPPTDWTTNDNNRRNLLGVAVSTSCSQRVIGLLADGQTDWEPDIPPRDDFSWLRIYHNLTMNKLANGINLWPWLGGRVSQIGLISFWHIYLIEVAMGNVQGVRPGEEERDKCPTGEIDRVCHTKQQMWPLCAFNSWRISRSFQTVNHRFLSLIRPFTPRKPDVGSDCMVSVSTVIHRIIRTSLHCLPTRYPACQLSRIEPVTPAFLSVHTLTCQLSIIVTSLYRSI